MAKSTRLSDLNRWKRKFLGVTEGGGDGATSETNRDRAQKFINIFRQLSVLSPEAQERYNEMLLNITPETKEELSKLPFSADVRGYIAYLQEQRGIVVEEEIEIDEEKLEEEKARAKIIAEAISLSHQQTAEKMQEQSMAQVEQLTKTLAAAQNRNASAEDITKITAALQEAQSNFFAAQQKRRRKRKKGDEEGEGVSDEEGYENSEEGEDGDEDEEYEYVEEYDDGYYPPMASAGNTADAIASAVADALVKSQESTSEIISKALGEALTKRPPVQVSDSGGNIHDFADMLAESQEKTAQIISEAVKATLNRPEEKHNEDLKEVASMLSESQEKTAKIISDALTASKEKDEPEEDKDAAIKEIAAMLAESQEKTAHIISDALTASKEKDEPEEDKDAAIKEIAAMLAQSQEKTAQIVSDALAVVTGLPVSAGNDNRNVMEMLVASQEKTSQVLSSILEKMVERENVEYEYVSAEDFEEESAEAEEVYEEDISASDMYDDTYLEPDYGSFDEDEFVVMPKPEPEPEPEEVWEEVISEPEPEPESVEEIEAIQETAEPEPEPLAVTEPEPEPEAVWEEALPEAMPEVEPEPVLEAEAEAVEYEVITENDTKAPVAEDDGFTLTPQTEEELASTAIETEAEPSEPVFVDEQSGELDFTAEPAKVLEVISEAPVAKDDGFALTAETAEEIEAAALTAETEESEDTVYVDDQSGELDFTAEAVTAEEVVSEADVSDDAEYEYEYEYITVDQDGNEITVSASEFEALQASADEEAVYEQAEPQVSEIEAAQEDIPVLETEPEELAATEPEPVEEVEAIQEALSETAQEPVPVVSEPKVEAVKEVVPEPEPIKEDLYFADTADAAEFTVDAYLDEVISSFGSDVSSTYATPLPEDLYFDENLTSEDLIFDEEMEMLDPVSFATPMRPSAIPLIPEQTVAIDIDYSEAANEPTVQIDEPVVPKTEPEAEASEPVTVSKEEPEAKETETAAETVSAVSEEDISEPVDYKNLATNTIIEKVIISPVREKPLNTGASFWLKDKSKKRKKATGPCLVFASSKGVKVRLDLGRAA